VIGIEAALFKAADPELQRVSQPAAATATRRFLVRARVPSGKHGMRFGI
jgi:hypothetical protein